MSDKLYVNNEDIKVAISAYATHANESVKFEGKYISKEKFAIYMNSQKFTALDVEVLDAIYKLKFSTSRQITQYLNEVRGIPVTQGDIAKRLGILNNNNCIARYSFVSDERQAGTNAKFYILQYSGKCLLNNRTFNCKWSPYETGLISDAKKYLVRNEYILKILRETGLKFNDIKMKPEIAGVEAAYEIKGVEHYIIPIRRTPGYKEYTIQAIDNLIQKLGCLTATSTKIIILVEDIQLAVELYVAIAGSKDKELLKNNVLFCNDLSLLSDLENMFVMLGIVKDTLTGKYKRVVNTVLPNELQNNN